MKTAQKSMLNDTLMLLSPCHAKQAVHRRGGGKLQARWSSSLPALTRYLNNKVLIGFAQTELKAREEKN